MFGRLGRRRNGGQGSWALISFTSAQDRILREAGASAGTPGRLGEASLPGGPRILSCARFTGDLLLPIAEERPLVYRFFTHTNYYEVRANIFDGGIWDSSNGAAGRRLAAMARGSTGRNFPRNGTARRVAERGAEASLENKRHRKRLLTPSVVGDHLFLMASQGLDNEFVEAIDANSHQRIWSTRVGNVGNPKQQPNFPTARSTPTVDGDFLYALAPTAIWHVLMPKPAPSAGKRTCPATSAANILYGPTRNRR